MGHRGAGGLGVLGGLGGSGLGGLGVPGVPGVLGFLCLALLCSGHALNPPEEEPGTGNGTEATPEGTPGPPEPPGQPGGDTKDGDTEGTAGSEVTTPRDRDTEGTAGSKVTTSHPRDGDLEVTTEGNRTGSSPPVPARFWSPVLFVLLALLVLFVTYHRTKDKGQDKGLRDRVTSGSDSSDLGALVQPHIHEPIPKIPTPQREGKDPEPPPGPELIETSLDHPQSPKDPSGIPEQQRQRSQIPEIP